MCERQRNNIMLHLSILLAFSTLFLGYICHTEKGTVYEREAILAYAEGNHGPDGTLFLDPYFKSAIENLKDHKVLDAGCGAAPWAIYAAKNGGQVYAIDIQENMVQAASQAIRSAHVENQVQVTQGDVAALPYETNFFDVIISICVGCNLPMESFEKHIKEVDRTLKDTGRLVIGAPASLNVIFTDASKSDQEAFRHIQKSLDQLPDHPTCDQIIYQLNQLVEVRSATFFMKNNQLCLLENEDEICEGEKIWRKLSNLVVPNYYYSKDFYLQTFEKLNLTLQRVDASSFENEEKRKIYNANASEKSRLGPAYVLNAPFIVFHLSKQ